MMNKKCLVVISILLLIIVAGFYKFILQGSARQSTDERTAILLNAGERDLVLAEMRVFLSSVQQISHGLSENDMALVAAYARKSGKAAQAEIPGTLAGKLPLQFKQLGFDTHKKFDQLAMDAEDLEDEQHTLEQLSILMQNCVSCHATYRIAI